MHIKFFLMLLLVPFAASKAMEFSEKLQEENKNRRIIILPKEMHLEILQRTIKSSGTVQEATKIIRSWAHVNRHCYQFVNSDYGTQRLLQNLANRFYKSTPQESHNWECHLRTPGSGKRLAEWIAQRDNKFHELYFKWRINPSIFRGDRRLSLFVMTYFPITLKSLQEMLYSLHHDQSAKDRDNTKIRQRVKEMYVAQHVKRISQNIRTGQ